LPFIFFKRRIPQNAGGNHKTKVLSLAPLKAWGKRLRLIMPRRGIQSKIEEQFFWFLFDANLKRNTPVFIYQMGKVASSSVNFSLNRVYPGVVLHAHSFGPDHHEWRIRRLFERTVLEGNPLDIISLTREPIGRNISAFFENFERDTGSRYANHEFSMTELREQFLNNYDHEIPLVWFDKNIKDNFDIDVYASPFPDEGVESYRKGNIRLLVLRSEIEDNLKISAIRDFLHLPEFDLHQRNVASQKEYADEYRQFVKSVKLPSDYLTRMINSKYFNHFYDSNLAEEVRRWWAE
jgi:hypothetical protein